MSSDDNGSNRSANGGTRRRLLLLTIGALGVVYGDIGTSPLYAIKESFNPSHGLPLTTLNIMGVESLVFWALIFVVSIKYLVMVLRADNKGEGGIMALLSLLLPRPATSLSGLKKKTLAISLGLIGAGLLYGEGIITPAISVLSALEGLQVATPAFEPIIVPVTIVILFLLFSAQSRGSASIGTVFGPTMFLWFISIGLIGLSWIIRYPQILYSLNPYYAFKFFSENGITGFFVLSSVVLCITGAEALYADIGHFGKAPIRLGWFSMVFPCLMLNYLGQGAFVLAKGAVALENPFFGIVPKLLLYPMVVLATTAAVIASQALISGAFSLTQQAVQLGYLPRTAILHTSRTTEGQIYVPKINLLLMVACIALVLVFKRSTHLAAAYGIAVTGTMVITSILFYLIATRIWKWATVKAGIFLVLFLVIDVSFFSANTTKVAHGGWIPLLIAAIVFATMTTWKRGREFLSKFMIERATSLEDFFRVIKEKNPPRVPGTAVFMTLTRDIAPSVLLQHFKHNKSLHNNIILLSIVVENYPDVSALERVRVTELENGFIKIVARYGYMEAPDITEVLSLAEGAGLQINIKELSYFLGRETIIPKGNSGLSSWRKKVFILLSRNARSAAEYFNLPQDRVIEIGTQIQI